METHLLFDDEEPWREPARARRIRDRNRMRARAYRIAASLFQKPGHPWDDKGRWADLGGQIRHGLKGWPDVIERRRAHAVRRAGNRQPCSCQGCGNPRRHCGGPDLQERRFLCDAAQQLEASGAPPLPRRIARPSWR